MLIEGASLDPQGTSMKGLVVSIRLYLGCLKGYGGGAGRQAGIPDIIVCKILMFM